MTRLLAAAVCLGLIQGLGEFLPISSSGHLILAQALFGLAEPELAFDVVLHLGTLAALCFFYRRPLAGLTAELKFLPGALSRPARLAALFRERPDFRFGLCIIIGSAPTALIGFSGKSLFETSLSSVDSVCVALIATGVMLRLIGQKGEKGRRLLTVRDALFIGFIQGLAITPGLSRSGWTIGAGLWVGLDRETAARYSFLLSIPAILGAVILEARHIEASAFSAVDFGAGFLTAAVTGFFALRFLTRLLKSGRLAAFSWWCWAVGAGALIVRPLIRHLDILYGI